MSYSNDQFTVKSSETGVMAGILTSNSFYCAKLKENLSILPFIILITDSSENVLYKYTLEPVYINSSDLISFEAIDETYVRKTFLEEHTHEISAINELQTILDGKSNTGHSRAISDATNLQATLDGKAASSHTHAISEITNLQTNLDAKASSSHIHTISDLTDYKSDLLDKISYWKCLYLP